MDRRGLKLSFRDGVAFAFWLDLLVEGFGLGLLVELAGLLGVREGVLDLLGVREGVLDLLGVALRVCLDSGRPLVPSLPPESEPPRGMVPKMQ